ncbi:hypothetical protein [Gordonia sp. ABSL49_1]|nr:hypothetical protein [Gordonia sp. ABSL49_1]MCH5645187.1 hypothetical protein [Gordonia sp. ABSL49_1]
MNANQITKAQQELVAEFNAGRIDARTANAEMEILMELAEYAATDAA